VEDVGYGHHGLGPAAYGGVYGGVYAPYVAAPAYHGHAAGYGYGGYGGYINPAGFGPPLAPHVGYAVGHDLVGPFAHHDGPFGPFGFYSNFHHH